MTGMTTFMTMQVDEPEEEKLYLSRSWRMLQSEVDTLLQLEDFHGTYKGTAPRLIKLLDAMEVIARHATVPLNEDVQKVEEVLLKTM